VIFLGLGGFYNNSNVTDKIVYNKVYDFHGYKSILNERLAPYKIQQHSQEKMLANVIPKSN